MDSLKALTDLLQNEQSAKRRSAARNLRKLGDPAAGPALLLALEKEINDPRTWETQYQMIMALGYCRHTNAVPLLRRLAHEKFEATIVLVAVGDAYVRTCRSSDEDPTPLFEILEVPNDYLLYDGALRAVAMLRMRFDWATTAEIIAKVSAMANESLRFWLVAACPGWSGPDVDRFIRECLSSPRQDVRDAAEEATVRKYRKWTPL